MLYSRIHQAPYAIARTMQLLPVTWQATGNATNISAAAEAMTAANLLLTSNPTVYLPQKKKLRILYQKNELKAKGLSKDRNKWVATVRSKKHGCSHFVGKFDTEEDAIASQLKVCHIVSILYSYSPHDGCVNSPPLYPYNRYSCLTIIHMTVRLRRRWTVWELSSHL